MAEQSPVAQQPARSSAVGWRGKVSGADLRKSIEPSSPTGAAEPDPVDEVVVTGVALEWADWWDIAFKAWVTFLAVGAGFAVLIGIVVGLVMWWFNL